MEAVFAAPPDPPLNAGTELTKAEKIREGRVARAARRRQVLQLAAAGVPYEDIAETVGATEAGVKQIIRVFVSKMDKLDLADAEAVRRVQLDRLDRMLLAVWQKASEGNLKAVDRVLKIEQLRARLTGTEAARRTELDVSGKVEHIVDAEEMKRIEDAFKASHPNVIEGDFVELGETAGLDVAPELPPGLPSGT